MVNDGVHFNPKEPALENIGCEVRMVGILRHMTQAR